MLLKRRAAVRWTHGTNPRYLVAQVLTVNFVRQEMNVPMRAMRRPISSSLPAVAGTKVSTSPHAVVPQRSTNKVQTRHGVRTSFESKLCTIFVVECLCNGAIVTVCNGFFTAPMAKMTVLHHQKRTNTQPIVTSTILLQTANDVQLTGLGFATVAAKNRRSTLMSELKSGRNAHHRETRVTTICCGGGETSALGHPTSNWCRQCPCQPRR